MKLLSRHKATEPGREARWAVVQFALAGLAGSRYPLGEEEVERLWSQGGVESEVAELSDLSGPENRFERSHGRLLEVYVPVQAPDGRPALFELYMRYSSVAASGRRIWLTFAPALAVALIALWLLQIPLAGSIVRRLRARERERERLLLHAMDASNAERRRIARDHIARLAAAGWSGGRFGVWKKGGDDTCRTPCRSRRAAVMTVAWSDREQAPEFEAAAERFLRELDARPAGERAWRLPNRGAAAYAQAGARSALVLAPSPDVAVRLAEVASRQR